VEIVYGMLSNVLEPDHSIVEFGSGTGSYAVPLARRCDRRSPSRCPEMNG
jgi:hypothetical protein